MQYGVHGTPYSFSTGRYAQQKTRKFCFSRLDYSMTSRNGFGLRPFAPPPPLSPSPTLLALLFLVCGSAGLVNALGAETSRRPNVLILFADDMRADSIAALGNPTVKTPNLDELVRRGFVF